MSTESILNKAFPESSKQEARSNRTKSVIVTGHRGFLGNAVLKNFNDDDYRISGIDAAKADKTKNPKCAREYEIALPDTRFDNVIAENQPSALIHCAGTADVAASFRDPPNDYRRNVESLAYVLESLRQCAPDCQLILLSSAAVYGNPRRLPMTESERCIPISPYGCHKLLGEQLVEDYVNEHGLKATVFRIFSAYGNGLRRQVIFDICRKLFDESQTKIQLYGSGEESRDFIHADDIAAAIDHAITKELTGVYNLGCGVETSIKSMAEKLRDYSGRDVEIKFTGKSRAGDPHRWQADIQKLRATEFEPATDLDAGLKSYLNWYRQTELN